MKKVLLVSMLGFAVILSACQNDTGVATPDSNGVTEEQTQTEVPEEQVQEEAPAAPDINNGENEANEMPLSPEVTQEMAIEIAQNHLTAEGYTGTFDDIETDFEFGRWVWEIDFEDRPTDTDFQFYIDMETGEILGFYIDR